MDWIDVSIVILKTLIIYVGVIQVVPVMIWVERKGAALIQDRPGPNRVGPFGLLQPVADALKFLFKEDPVPTNVNKLLYNLGPFMALLPASLVIRPCRLAITWRLRPQHPAANHRARRRRRLHVGD